MQAEHNSEHRPVEYRDLLRKSGFHARAPPFAGARFCRKHGPALGGTTAVMADGAAGAGEMPGESAPSARKQSRKHSVEDLTRQPIKRSGWLQKKGGQSRRNWKRRYFVLRGSMLMYYKHEEDVTMTNLSPDKSMDVLGVKADGTHTRYFKLVVADSSSGDIGDTRELPLYAKTNEMQQR